MLKRKTSETAPLDLEAFDREVAKLQERLYAEESTPAASPLGGRLATVALYAAGPVPVERG